MPDTNVIAFPVRRKPLADVLPASALAALEAPLPDDPVERERELDLRSIMYGKLIAERLAWAPEPKGAA